MRRLFAARVIAVSLVSVAALSVATASAQRDVTTATTVAATAGEIRGVVVTDESTPAPVRRAIVTLNANELPSSRSMLTDDAGRFAFLRLPAGKYAVNVKKAAWLPAAYGATKPGRQGSEIALAAGQRQSISITMTHGAVISGTLRDAAGQPLSGASVTLIDVRNGLNTLAPEQATTDDRGTYRFFGLMPGEYVVAAAMDLFVSGVTGARSDRDMDMVLQELVRRHPGGAAIAPAGATAVPLPHAPPVGYAPIYYPGAAAFSDAARIRLAPGEDRTGVDFAMFPVPVATLNVSVTGEGTAVASVQLSVISSGPRIASMPLTMIMSQMADGEGRFKFSNVPAGPVRVMAKGRRVAADAAAGGDPLDPLRARVAGLGIIPPSGPVPPAEWLYGVADTEVQGAEQSVSVLLRPGATLKGRVVFDAASAPVPADLAKISVSAIQPAPGNNAALLNGAMYYSNLTLAGLPAVPIAADGTFELAGLGPTPYTLRCNLPANLGSVWALRSATVNGRDLLDAPLELAPGQTLSGVVLTLSDRRTDVSGQLQSPAGQPASAYVVVALPADRALWTSGSRRIRSTRPSTDGRFSFADLPAGTYLLATLTDLDPNDLQDPDFLAAIAQAGVKVVLGEGEKKTQDLKIVG